MASATLLLPARSRLSGSPLPAAIGTALARADRQQADAGEHAQLKRHFQLIPDHWPVAALTRQLDAGDAPQHSWLRVDPAYVAPDMGGARMLSHGEALALTSEDAAQFLPALKPLFGDAGFILDAPVPSRWYLQLPMGSKLPPFAEPDRVLGEDLFAHLPEGDLGRRWRALLTESQVVLHNHAWNKVRTAQGKAPVNSLWFWGAGALPDVVRTRHLQVKGSDITLRALALAAGVGPTDDAERVDALLDLRHLRSVETLANDALAPLLMALGSGELSELALDFEDGTSFSMKRRQRWRFWRRAMTSLGA